MRVPDEMKKYLVTLGWMLMAMMASLSMPGVASVEAFTTKCMPCHFEVEQTSAYEVGDHDIVQVHSVVGQLEAASLYLTKVLVPLSNTIDSDHTHVALFKQGAMHEVGW